MREITLESFAKKYGLQGEEAARLYRISGPSETKLDVFMRAKGIKPVGEAQS